MPLKTVFAILSAQEGVLNSSSNNSKFKNIDELKARMAAKSGGAGGFGGWGFARAVPGAGERIAAVE